MTLVPDTTINGSQSLTSLLTYNSHRTAMTRHKLSAPSRWIKEQGLLRGEVLDYGCGKGKDAKLLRCDKYDPYYFPSYPYGLYDTILCTYVLNTMPVRQREEVIKSVISLLTVGGRAFFTVRRDIKQDGTTSTGTFQETVKLSEDKFQLLTQDSKKAIYSYYKGG